ncbi:hypothetical protein TZ00_04195 [Agreia bicolorata]|uniref:Uncharacterized protein n=1 Tax=Agreia bicolorata TaxID=110935 RepID=A0ABR5CGR7_9MICO|nr:hypothetical protein TZ00_04195 [Agreia bicolorata]
MQRGPVGTTENTVNHAWTASMAPRPTTTTGGTPQSIHPAFANEIAYAAVPSPAGTATPAAHSEIATVQAKNRGCDEAGLTSSATASTTRISASTTRCEASGSSGYVTLPPEEQLNPRGVRPNPTVTGVEPVDSYCTVQGVHRSDPQTSMAPPVA